MLLVLAIPCALTPHGRPKVRCRLIKSSTDEQCRNLFAVSAWRNGTHSFIYSFDLLGTQVPLLTFDRTAEDFECLACRNYCHCSRKRGKAYVPERDGGWRSWVARQGGSHRAASTPTSKSKSREPVSVLLPAKQRSTKTTTTTDAQVFNVSWSATAVFTVSGEPLSSAFLHGNKTHIVPVS
ncbi:hypothetical protein EDB85DRAFT_1564834 [Lactarius pseudohatsudake]|nr:hypothetical protein EDB85DRAFT_1564834 [Lactarius pseudohatsudake]